MEAGRIAMDELQESLETALARMARAELVALMNIPRKSTGIAHRLQQWIDEVVVWEVDRRNGAGGSMPALDPALLASSAESIPVLEETRTEALHALDNMTLLFHTVDRHDGTALLLFFDVLQRELANMEQLPG